MVQESILATGSWTFGGLLVFLRPPIKSSRLWGWAWGGRVGCSFAAAPSKGSALLPGLPLGGRPCQPPPPSHTWASALATRRLAGGCACAWTRAWARGHGVVAGGGTSRTQGGPAWGRDTVLLAGHVPVVKSGGAAARTATGQGVLSPLLAVPAPLPELALELGSLQPATASRPVHPQQGECSPPSPA